MKIVVVMGIMATFTCVLGYTKEAKEQLTEKVELLETRIEVLEKALLEKRQNEKPLAPEKQQWRELRKGMSQKEVRQLLGEPIRIEGGFLTHWYYLSNETAGYVIFDDYAKVCGWGEPQ